MANPTTSTFTLTPTGEILTIEVEKVTLNITPEDQQSFAQAPDQFVAALLKAKGEVVNGLQMTTAATEHFKLGIRAAPSPATGGPGGPEPTVWHCTNPPKSKSNRIVITQTVGKK
jgi:hypothetical protein